MRSMHIKILNVLLIFSFVAFSAQQTTINLDNYKNNKKYSFAQAQYTVGKHTYTVINIKPLFPADTACISAVVIDKRKFVFPDVGVAAGAFGLIVPKKQPIASGLIILKASPLDAKTFLIFPSGKMITLPGTDLIVDTVGKTVYSVWENDAQFRLTVLDYQHMRVVIPTALVPQPLQWYTTDVTYCFSTANEKGYYTVDLMMNSITKTDKTDDTPKPVSYCFDLKAVDLKKCCTTGVLEK